MKTKILSLIALPFALPALCFASGQLTVKASNQLPITRASQTIELTGKDLAPLGEKDLEKIHVKDSSGKEVLCQAVDTDYDDYHKPDIVIFQADFAPKETKTFTVTSGKKHEYSKDDFRAYGRFVHNYHSDMGEGLDDYSAGATRGCGGSGIWANNQLVVPSNFVDSRVLANGPIRVMFELVYEPFDVNGTKVSELLRVSLDAGSQLDHFQTRYKSPGGNETWAVAIGIKKVKDELKEFNAEHGWLSIWEPMEKNLGMQGVAAIVNPKEFDRQAEDKQNNLVVLKPGTETPVSYWAGFAWDRSGKITSSEAWKKYVEEFSEGLLSPLVVTISP